MLSLESPLLGGVNISNGKLLANMLLHDDNTSDSSCMRII